jgi:hypothetical protein
MILLNERQVSPEASLTLADVQKWTLTERERRNLGHLKSLAGYADVESILLRVEQKGNQRTAVTISADMLGSSGTPLGRLHVKRSWVSEDTAPVVESKWSD